MRIRLLGSSCIVVALLCAGVATLATFLGAILVGQSVSNVSFPIITATATVLTAPISPTKAVGSPTSMASDEPAMSVTLVAPDTPASFDASTATPQDLPPVPGSNMAIPSASPFIPDVPLGTLDYPLTVTAQARVMGTQVNAYRGSVDTTRTAAALRVIPTHLALTQTATTGGK